MKYAILPLFFALMLCAQVTPEQFDTAMGLRVFGDGDIWSESAQSLAARLNCHMAGDGAEGVVRPLFRLCEQIAVLRLESRPDSRQ